MLHFYKYINIFQYLNFFVTQMFSRMDVNIEGYISWLIKTLQTCNVGGVPGVGQAEQYCTLGLHKLSCLYSTPDASLASVEVWSI